MRNYGLFKHFSPSQELFHTLVAEFLQALGCFQNRQHTVGTRLGIEFVGIAHQLFLYVLWLKAWQTCARMALSYTGVTLPPLATQQFTTNLAVADIRLRAVAKDGGGVTPADADIVEHGRLLYKLAVNAQFRMSVTNQQATVGDLPRVLHEQPPQVAVLRIVLVNNNLIIHFSLITFH